MISGGKCVHVARTYSFKKEKKQDLEKIRKYDLDPFITRPAGQCVIPTDIDAMKIELSKILRGLPGKNLANTIRDGVSSRPLNPGVVAQYDRSSDRVDIHGRSRIDFTSAIYLNGRMRNEKIYFPILELIATDKQGERVRNHSFEQALNEVLQPLTTSYQKRPQRTSQPILKPAIFFQEQAPWKSKHF